VIVENDKGSITLWNNKSHSTTEEDSLSKTEIYSPRRQRRASPIMSTSQFTGYYTKCVIEPMQTNSPF